MNGRMRAWRLLIWSAILLVPLMLGACATRGGVADDPTPDDATEAAAPQPGEGQATGQAMGQGQGQGQVDCSTVRCAACPEGQTPALKPPNCCRCVKVDTNVTDCSAVRCAACPEGQRPSLAPPDCCRCVPA